MKAFWTMGLVGLLTSGCAHSINYKLTDLDVWHGSKIDKVVRVQFFVDRTAPVTQRVIKDGEFEYRTNYRGRYAKGQIADGVTAMVVKHLKHSGIFKNVVPAGSSVAADYELTGAITEYYAQGRINKGAEAAVTTGAIVGGLFGASIASGLIADEETEIQAKVVLQPVTLRATGDAQPMWTDTIEVNTNFPSPWTAADEPAVYVHVDNCLKDAVSELIHRLGVDFTLRTKTGSPSLSPNQ